MAPGDPWTKRHRRLLRWASVAIPIAVVAFILISYSDVIPVTFSGSDYTFTGSACYAGPACYRIGEETVSSGPNVTVRWVDVSGGSVSFYVNAPGPVRFCSEQGSSGTCSFVSTGGEYDFYAVNAVNEAAQLVNYTGSYDKSLL